MGKPKPPGPKQAVKLPSAAVERSSNWPKVSGPTVMQPVNVTYPLEAMRSMTFAVAPGSVPSPVMVSPFWFKVRVLLVAMDKTSWLLSVSALLVEPESEYVPSLARVPLNPLEKAAVKPAAEPGTLNVA